MDEIINEFRLSFFLYIYQEFKAIKLSIESKINEYNMLIKNEDIFKSINEIKEKIENLERKNKKLLDLYLDDKLSKIEFTDKKENIEREISSLQIELDGLNNGESKNIIMRDELINLSKDIQKEIKNKTRVTEEGFINDIDYILVNGDDVKIVTILERSIEYIKTICE